MNQTSCAFDAIGNYYDLLYHDKNYSEETAYILNLLERLSFSGKDVLEFGSGTGQHGRLLAKNGLNILGVELSDTMLARSFDTDGFKAVKGDARTFNTRQKFDLVLSLFHVMSYQVTDLDKEAAFRNAFNHLNKNGILIFDCWFSPAVHHQRPSTRVKRISNQDFEIFRIAEPEIIDEKNLVNVNYTVFMKDKESGLIQSFKEQHKMRHFSIPEMDRIAIQSGFEQVNVESFLDRKTPDTSTWGVCFAYRKKSNE